MRDSFYLAWRYTCYHRLTTAVLVTAISLITFLPAGLDVIVDNAAEHFRSRAAQTPLLLGAKGSSLDLVLSSLYFDQTAPDTLTMKQADRIEKQELATVIPLHARFQARDCPIIGTTAEYFAQRKLDIAEGREWKMLGECVVGARAADRLGLAVGSRVPVSGENVFTLKDAPLRLHVVGVLAPKESPDDEAIFVNLKTTWLVEGLGHGHAHGAKHGSPEAAEYTDVTKENVGSFHFHGSEAKYPITAIIAVPQGADREKAETLLLGQYFSPDETVQIVRPSEVMDALLAKVLMVRSYLVAIVLVVSLVTLLTLALVVVLSIRLRRQEIVTMTKMGCSRFAIGSVLGSQVVIILAVSVLLATAMTLVTDAYAPELVRLLIL